MVDWNSLQDGIKVTGVQAGAMISTSAFPELLNRADGVVTVEDGASVRPTGGLPLNKPTGRNPGK